LLGIASESYLDSILLLELWHIGYLGKSAASMLVGRALPG
jgi:hypothetical protein